MLEKYKASVALNNLRIRAHIGVTDKEQNELQDIDVSFRIYFPGIPKACLSDDINDTICYHQMSEIIRKYCAENRVRLLEYLCYQLHTKIKESIEIPAAVWVKVDKCNPPIKNFSGNTSFEYGEL